MFRTRLNCVSHWRPCHTGHVQYIYGLTMQLLVGMTIGTVVVIM